MLTTSNSGNRFFIFFTVFYIWLRALVGILVGVSGTVNLSVPYDPFGDSLSAGGKCFLRQSPIYNDRIAIGVLDREINEENKNEKLPEHNNIRGSKYYK